MTTCSRRISTLLGMSKGIVMIMSGWPHESTHLVEGTLAERANRTCSPCNGFTTDCCSWYASIGSRPCLSSMSYQDQQGPQHPGLGGGIGVCVIDSLGLTGFNPSCKFAWGKRPLPGQKQLQNLCPGCIDVSSLGLYLRKPCSSAF